MQTTLTVGVSVAPALILVDVPAAETPAEHVRNALQLLYHLHETEGLQEEQRADLAAALRRVERALQLLEHRPQP